MSEPMTPQERAAAEVSVERLQRGRQIVCAAPQRCAHLLGDLGQAVVPDGELDRRHGGNASAAPPPRQARSPARSANRLPAF